MKTREEKQLCDACGEGHLHPMTSKESAEYKGTQGQFIVHFSVCDVCKSEIIDASDALKNKREMVRFRKSVDHIPLGAEIAEMRRRHHLTQPLAAAIFGGGPVAFSKYENDDLIPDEAMVSLLKLAIAYPDTVLRLARIKGIELSRPVFQEAIYEVSLSHMLFDFKVQNKDTQRKTTQGPPKSKAIRRRAPKIISQNSGGLVRKLSRGRTEWTIQ